MNPFDQAWGLLKMPIVPHSLKQVGKRKHEARFIDPVTGQELPMTSSENPMWELRISDEKGNDRANTLMDSRHYGTFQSEGSETKEPYRRRGYMTALYDMAARLAADEPNEDEEGGWRLRQGLEEEEGMGDLLWEKINREAWDRGGDGLWPVRDDLYEGGQK